MGFDTDGLLSTGADDTDGMCRLMAVPVDVDPVAFGRDPLAIVTVYKPTCLFAKS